MTMTSPFAQTAAETFVKAWVTGERLSTLPPAPASVREMYETHRAIQEHPLVADRLGGHGGYKLGAIGAEGEACISAPLFGGYLVNAPGSKLSSGVIQMWQIEPEIGVIMGSDLPVRTDGLPHAVDAVWAAVDQVVLCIECCGKRGIPESYAASTKLGSFADTLSSGGVVLGPRLAASGVSIDDVQSCASKLMVNDELVADGSGAATPEGGPAQALTWLANHLNSRGLSLARGQLIATGQMCNTQTVKPGDRIRASFGELGSCEMVVSP